MSFGLPTQEAIDSLKETYRAQRRERLGESQGRLTSRAEDAGLRGPQIDQFVGLGEEARGLRTRERRSQAAQDIMRQQRELAGAQMGVGAAARGPFAGATQQAAQRAVGAGGAQAAAQAGAADLARLRQTDEMMQQLQTQGEIQQYQEAQARKAAEEERDRMFSGGIGSALGSAIGALGFFGGPAVGAATMAAGGQLGGALGQEISDEDMKSNIKDGNPKTRKMLDALSAKEYDIDGERDYGVMAQDMPEEMVKEVDGVKTIPEGFGKLLAGMANLNDRLKKLEGK
tara:strand:- start:18095 stop:18952 length:858 start_codon:yes stop_codon:yes gene_type:complete